jgi:hypothetical protein
MVLGLFVLTPCFAQDLGEDVDDLKLVEVSSAKVKLSWRAVEPSDSGTTITYSVFRGTKEDFIPSIRNRIVSGLRQTWYVATEPASHQDYYYLVKAVVTTKPHSVDELRLKPSPGDTDLSEELHSGLIMAYPLSPSKLYVLTLGGVTQNCMSWSATELDCTIPTGPLSGLLVFHALIAAQGNQEYLIGCEGYNYESGNWTCADLPPGHWYTVVVHEGTVSVVDSGISRINAQTGKALGAITPVYTILTKTK